MEFLARRWHGFHDLFKITYVKLLQNTDLNINYRKRDIGVMSCAISKRSCAVVQPLSIH